MPWKQVEKTKSHLLFENTQTGETVKASKIYDHAELGVFYAFDNILQMPYSRKYIFDLAQQMEKIGIEKDELADKMKQIQDLCKDKKQGFEMDVYAIAQTVERLVKDNWDYQKTAMLVTSIIIIQEGEAIGMFDQAQAMHKTMQWKMDANMLGFFLSIAAERCNKVSNSFANFTPLFSENLSQSKER
jgi:hypothetical protein